MNRSAQARQLGRHLSETTRVSVELVYDYSDVWIATWVDGPIRDQMRQHIADALTDDQYAAMRDRRINTSRSTSPRAWAARAVASRREGTFTPAVQAGVVLRQSTPQFGTTYNDPFTPEDYAALRHVEILLDSTSDPDRASAPADEAVIEELLAAGGRHPTEYTMVRVLAAVDRAPTGDGPAQLRRA